MSSSIDLTAEQRAVVTHTSGPAVVRAVPGAGKTTVMAHRIHRLVETHGVPPDRILASSFSRDTVEDLAALLNAIGVRGVNPQTLHALGLSLLRARSGGKVLLEEAPAPTAAARILARRARIGLAAKRDIDTADLNISAQELADQVAAWKQQLAYPDPDAADLSDAAQEQARTATHENDDFVALYRRFERHRRQEGWLTYADMLREGWATLMNDDTLLDKAQARYRFVLVDEFQDVSRVQFLLLDALTAKHQNYMVVGDADQCIYGWRGADPSFLLDFADRYDATTYNLTDSFRLPAAPLVLANAVIEENERRSPKRLHLTQGFSETTELLAADGSATTASRIAETVESLREKGHSLHNIAVLVRTYGQTPPLERAFLDRGLPYRIRGSPPFYRRREVQTLLQYLYWAVLEHRLRETGWFADEKTADRYTDRFARILKTPNRYVQHGRIDRVVQEARRRRVSVLGVLRDHRSGMHDRTTERVENFLDVAEEVVGRLDAPPSDTLNWLIDAIDYESALRERSAFAERGDARVRTTRALVRHAERYDSTPALLRDVRSLVAERQTRDDDDSALDLRSIHRAKGAEWPVVIVPGCTESILPLDREEERDLEEERRLFYVALTRPTKRLFLATDSSKERSRFLDEAELDTRFDAIRHVRTGLTCPPSSLSDEAVARLCQGLIRLNLERFVRKRWSPTDEQAQAFGNRLEALGPTIERAVKHRNAYRQARAEHAAKKRQARAAARERAAALQAELGNAPLAATNEQPDTYYPTDARFTFRWKDDDSLIDVIWNETRVGTLDPLGTHRLDAQSIMNLPWEAIVGRFEGVAQGRNVLRFTIDWAATTSAFLENRIGTLSPPDQPDEHIRLFTCESVRSGYTLLRETVD